MVFNGFPGSLLQRTDEEVGESHASQLSSVLEQLLLLARNPRFQSFGYGRHDFPLYAVYGNLPYKQNRYSVNQVPRQSVMCRSRNLG